MGKTGYKVHISNISELFKHLNWGKPPSYHLENNRDYTSDDYTVFDKNDRNAWNKPSCTYFKNYTIIDFPFKPKEIQW